MTTSIITENFDIMGVPPVLTVTSEGINQPEPRYAHNCFHVNRDNFIDLTQMVSRASGLPIGQIVPNGERNWSYVGSCARITHDDLRVLTTDLPAGELSWIRQYDIVEKVAAHLISKGVVGIYGVYSDRVLIDPMTFEPCLSLVAQVPIVD